MKPNFETMSTKELIDYVKTHRDDDEAIDALVSRRTPDEEATWYPPVTTPDGVPIEENIRIMEEAFRQQIEKLKKQ